MNTKVVRWCILLVILALLGSAGMVANNMWREQAARNQIEDVRKSIMTDYAPFIRERASDHMSPVRFAQVEAQYEICKADEKYFPFYSTCLLQILEQRRENGESGGIFAVLNDNALARFMFVLIGANTRLNRLLARIEEDESIDAVLVDLQKVKAEVENMYKGVK